MSGARKLLDAMRGNPRDWRIDDVRRPCEAFDIVRMAPRGGSHYKVAHEMMPTILTIPAHRPIKPVYIRDLIAFVDAVREYEA